MDYSNYLLKRLGLYFYLDQKSLLFLSKSFSKIFDSKRKITQKESMKILSILKNKKRKRRIDSFENEMNMIKNFILESKISYGNMIDYGGGSSPLCEEIKKMGFEKTAIVDYKAKEFINIETFEKDEKDKIKFCPVIHPDDFIKLKDNSLNLVTAIYLLHHIPSGLRLKILQNIYDKLRVHGILIIKEHDYNYDNNFYNFLELYHELWYILNNEERDILNLVSKKDLEMTLFGIGFKKIKEDKFEKSLQRIYFSVFQK